MWAELAPCASTSEVVQVALVALNTFQAVMIAWLAHRRKTADRRLRQHQRDEEEQLRRLAHGVQEANRNNVHRDHGSE